MRCYEAAGNENRAYEDPHLLTNSVFTNLLKSEEKNCITTNAFPSVQTEVTEQMRKIVAEWMLEVRRTSCNHFSLVNVMIVAYYP